MTIFVTVAVIAVHVSPARADQEAETGRETDEPDAQGSISGPHAGRRSL